jgi:GTPase
MLIDEVDITIQAGHGGAGKSSFSGHGPDGGNGGRGGDVYITVTSDLRALNQFSVDKNVVAADGEHGSNNRCNGKDGKDTEINLPVGCLLTREDSDEVVEFTEVGARTMICRGGLGGLGNFEFKSGKNRAPKYAQPGRVGDFKKFHVVLKYLADFGLIGLPNAGKSSLLNELTHARAQVGAYPFTTLEANLGVFDRFIIADIPGLIAGASQGRGLGIKFLKHIEKVRLLFHCLAADSADIVADYHTINTELASFSAGLAAKPQVILLTKTDLLNPGQTASQKHLLEQFKLPVYGISIYDPESIQNLKNTIISLT